MAEDEGGSKTSEAVVVSMYPDVCLKDGKPVPYDIYGLGSDDMRHSPDVRYTKFWALNERTRLSTSYGDDPASAGVQSGVVKGVCRPVADWAEKVRVNGVPAVRHDTEFEMNCAGPNGSCNTTGKLVYVRNKNYKPLTPEEEAEFERKRKEMLERLKGKFDQPDFYNQLADYDPANAKAWNDMAGVQEGFRAGEAGYDAATRAYSESMRQTLHQSTINLFENPTALHSVQSSSSTGLYDWYIRMHGTAFRENGAWNSDMLGRGLGVMGNTSPKMLGNTRNILGGMWEHDPFTAKAVEQVREMRRRKGLRVSRKPGELQPETIEEMNRPIDPNAFNWPI